MAAVLNIVPFIDDEEEFKVFMNGFLSMVHDYHRESHTEEFEFDYARFVTMWQQGELGLFIATDGNDAMGFTVAFKSYGFFEKSPTWVLSYAYIKESHRGDLMFIKDSIAKVMSYREQYGCSKGMVLSTPELMPLHMQNGAERIVFSGVTYSG